MPCWGPTLQVENATARGRGGTMFHVYIAEPGAKGYCDDGEVNRAMAMCQTRPAGRTGEFPTARVQSVLCKTFNKSASFLARIFSY